MDGSHQTQLRSVKLFPVLFSGLVGIFSKATLYLEYPHLFVPRKHLILFQGSIQSSGEVAGNKMSTKGMVLIQSVSEVIARSERWDETLCQRVPQLLVNWLNQQVLKLRKMSFGIS